MIFLGSGQFQDALDLNAPGRLRADARSVQVSYLMGLRSKLLLKNPIVNINGNDRDVKSKVHMLQDVKCNFRFRDTKAGCLYLKACYRGPM